MRRFDLLVSVAAVSLAGCMSSDVQRHAAFDPGAKTITVPAGSSGLLGGVKQALAAAGWRMVVDSGPTVTEGTIGARTRLETSDTFRTRYRLVGRSQRFDLCVVGGGAYYYDLSIIDNRTGTEVLTMSGRDCETPILRKFAEAIR